MPRFSANISMMFLEQAALERPTAARAAGFEAIELQFPYDIPAADWGAARRKAGVDVAVFNIPVGDMLTGGPGLASMPGREADFVQALAQAHDYAVALRPRKVNVLAGWPPPGLNRRMCLDVLAGNLAVAARMMAEIGVGVTVEAVNSRDRPGYFLTRTDEALEAITLADHPNLGLEHDFYHMQIMEGDLAPTLERVLPRIGHIQFADTPGRHEPGTGEINFPFLFALIDRLGYTGWVGAEYVPSTQTEKTLGWMKGFRGT